MPPRLKDGLVANLNSCKYDVLREVADRQGYSIMAADEEDDSCWDLLWSDLSVTSERVSKLRPFQRLNHFPSMLEICRKAALSRHMGRMAVRLPGDYNFYPQSMVLPDQLDDLIAALKRSKARAEAAASATNPAPPLPTWILKPSGGTMGRGISLVQDVSGLQGMDISNCVAQAYVHNPLLLGGLKWDLRIYALVASVDPLRVLLYDEGLARLATEPYSQPSPANLRTACMHLTNYAVNKHAAGFKPSDASPGGLGTKRLASAVLQQVADEAGVTKARLVQDIAAIVVKTLLAVQPLLAHTYHTALSSSTHGSTSQPCTSASLDHGCSGGLHGVSPAHQTPPTTPRRSKAARASSTGSGGLGGAQSGPNGDAAAGLEAGQGGGGGGGGGGSAPASSSGASQGAAGGGGTYGGPTFAQQQAALAQGASGGEGSGGNRGSYAAPNGSVSCHACGCPPSQCFELLGFDIMFDADLRPWLLEVNHSPSFTCDSRLDKQVKSALLSDTLAALAQRPVEKAAWHQAQGKALAERLYSPAGSTSQGGHEGRGVPHRRPLSAVPKNQKLAAAAAALDALTEELAGGDASPAGHGYGSSSHPPEFARSLSSVGLGAAGGRSGSSSNGSSQPAVPVLHHNEIEGSYGLMPPPLGPNDPFRVGRYTQIYPPRESTLRAQYSKVLGVAADAFPDHRCFCAYCSRRRDYRHLVSTAADLASGGRAAGPSWGAGSGSRPPSAGSPQRVPPGGRMYAAGSGGSLSFGGRRSDTGASLSARISSARRLSNTIAAALADTNGLTGTPGSGGGPGASVGTSGGAGAAGAAAAGSPMGGAAGLGSSPAKPPRPPPARPSSSPFSTTGANGELNPGAGHGSGPGSGGSSGAEGHDRPGSSSGGLAASAARGSSASTCAGGGSSGTSGGDRISPSILGTRKAVSMVSRLNSPRGGLGGGQEGGGSALVPSMSSLSSASTSHAAAATAAAAATVAASSPGGGGLQRAGSWAHDAPAGGAAAAASAAAGAGSGGSGDRPSGGSGGPRVPRVAQLGAEKAAAAAAARRRKQGSSLGGLSTLALDCELLAMRMRTATLLRNPYFQVNVTGGSTGALLGYGEKAYGSRGAGEPRGSAGSKKQGLGRSQSVPRRPASASYGL